MQANESWIAMFRRIPGNLQNVLSVGLNTGVEIALQRILKLDPDLMIVRGRVVGTQDSGRIVLVPYAEISFVAITRLLRDPEVEAIFGKGGPMVAADIELSSTEDAALSDPAAETPAAEEPKLTEPAPAVNPAKKTEPSSKGMLLAKLRQKMKDDGAARK